MSDPWTARQQRHLAYVAEYTSEIRHMPGADNLVADSLSRPAASGSGATTCGCSSGAAHLNRTTQLLITVPGGLKQFPWQTSQQLLGGPLLRATTCHL